MVFRGATAAGEIISGYGADTACDVAGLVSRVGSLRYRSVMLWPRGVSMLDILELVQVASPLD